MSSLSFGGTSSGATSSQDVKSQILQQIQQEAAMSNARALIAVMAPIPPSNQFTSFLANTHPSPRNSTNTASTNASHHQARRSRRKRRAASHHVWKSTCRHGIWSVSSTWRGYSKRTRRGRYQQVEDLNLYKMYHPRRSRASHPELPSRRCTLHFSGVSKYRHKVGI